MPKAASTPNTVRIPGAPSGPSQPTSCGTPRQRRDADVIVNATDAPAPSAAAASTATCGEETATIAATSAGAVTTATSKTIETIAYAVSRWSASSTSAPHTERIAAGTWGNVAPPHSAQNASTQVGADSSAAMTSAASAGT